VENLHIAGVKPVPGDTEAAVSANDQIIKNYVPPMTHKLFVDSFRYDPPALPSNIYDSGEDKPDLKSDDADEFWYANDDANADAAVALLVSKVVDGLGLPELFTPQDSQKLVNNVTTEIKKVFNNEYSVWSHDTDKFYGTVIEDPNTKKKIRARIDLAYYAYHGKTQGKKDGVYLVTYTTSYVAKFSL